MARQSVGRPRPTARLSPRGSSPQGHRSAVAAHYGGGGESLPLPVHHTLSGERTPGGRGGPTIRMSVHEAGNGSGRPPVVLCHGFPDLAYAWRNQLDALAGAGPGPSPPTSGDAGQPLHRTTSTPTDSVISPATSSTCSTSLEIEQAVFVGHDWGGFVAWAMPVLFPERCAGVVGVCTPYTPFPSTELSWPPCSARTPRGMYMLWFQEPGVAETVLDRDPRLVFDKLMVGGVDPGAARRARHGAPIRFAVQSLHRSRRRCRNWASGSCRARNWRGTRRPSEQRGSPGAINWYRNIDENGRRYPEVGVAQLDLPALMICAE